MISDQGRRDEAEAIVRQAIAAAEAAIAQFPDNPLIRRNYALAFDNLGVVLDARNKPVDAEAAFRRALTAHERVAAARAVRSRTTAGRRDHGEQPRHPVAVAQAMGRRTGGVRAGRGGVRSPRKRVPGEPSLPRLVGGRPQRRRHAAPLARPRAERRAVVSQGYRDSRPHVGGVSRYVHLRDGVRRRVYEPRADLHRKGQLDDAHDWIGRGIERLEATLRRDPKSATVRTYLRNSLWARANLLERRKRYADAVPDWERSIEIVAESERADPRMRLALACARAGQWRRVAETVALVEPTPGLNPQRLNGLAVALALRRRSRRCD